MEIKAEYGRSELARGLNLSRVTLNRYVKAIKRSNYFGWVKFGPEGNKVIWDISGPYTDYHRWLIEKALEVCYWTNKDIEVEMRKLWESGELNFNNYYMERLRVMPTVVEECYGLIQVKYEKSS